MINNDKRKQIVYQKTEFNNHLICQFSNIFKCSKCKKNNHIYPNTSSISQNCLFCGNPNYIQREKKAN